MLFISWRHFTTERHAKRISYVCCEHCQAEYVYVLRRVSVGGGISPYGMADEAAAEEARDNAVQGLKGIFHRACDPVPCPECHLFQAHMFQRMRAKRYYGMEVGALATLVSCVLLSGFLGSILMANAASGSVEPLYWTTAVGLIGAVTGAVLWWLARKWRAEFDPNSIEASRRERMARRYAI